MLWQQPPVHLVRLEILESEACLTAQSSLVLAKGPSQMYRMLIEVQLPMSALQAEDSQRQLVWTG